MPIPTRSTALFGAPRAMLGRLPLGMVVRSFAGILVRGLEVAGKLALYVLVASRLGPHDAGLFFICLTWVSLAATAGRLGLERAVMRHVPAELATGHGRQAAAALRLGLVGTAAGGVGLSVLTALLAGPVARWIFGMPDLGWPLAVSALALAPQALSMTLGAGLIALKRPVVAQWVQNALWPLLTLVAMLAGVGSLRTLMPALAAASLATTAVGMLLLWRERSQFRVLPPAGPGEMAEALPPMWRTARPLLMVELVQVSLGAVPVLVLGMFADAAQVGAFSAANRISMLIWVVVISASTIAAPAFAEHHRRREWAALRRANRSVRLAVAVFGLPVLAVMLLAPATVLGLVGAAYRTAAGALVILALGQTVNCLLSCQDVLLAMTGNAQVLRKLNLLQLAVCLVGSATLIPLFGMTGAAVLTAVTIAQGAIGTTLVARRVLPGTL